MRRKKENNGAYEMREECFLSPEDLETGGKSEVKEEGQRT